MNVAGAAERVMGMTDNVWLRHANPLSVWSRFSCLPLLILAIWSRVWVGSWALVLTGLALGWIWLNPRVFAPPSDFGAWASRVTLGERIYLARDDYTIADHHLRAVRVLIVLPVLGLIPLIWGLWRLDVWATLAGTVLLVLPKVWFCDRMVWIHSDITHSVPGDPLADPTLPHERNTK